MQWYSASDDASVERIADAWSDAPVENEEILGMLLDVAQQQVLAYTPKDEDLDDDSDLAWVHEAGVPARLVYAQLQQAKNLFNAGRIVGDSAGGDGFTFVPRPLSKEIQKIIRPQSGVASVL